VPTPIAVCAAVWEIYLRTLEWLVVVALLPAIAGSLLAGQPGWMGWFAVLAAALVLLHAWLEGMHWQMGPAYLAAAVLLLEFTVHVNKPSIRISCAILAALLLVASIALSWCLPMFQLPAPTGRYPVGTRTYSFLDPNREETHRGAAPGNREVVAQFWYPAATSRGRKARYRRPKETTRLSSYQAVLSTHSLQDAPLAAGRFPVVVLNPAWHGFRNRGTFITQELASHGFVVAAISHTYNSSFVELSDGTVAHPDYGQDIGFNASEDFPIEGRIALANEELAIHTADCRFVLDELERFDRTPGHAFQAHLLMQRVGSCGYSFGGAVAAELAREDPRVRAALELDGAMHGESAAHGLNKPLLLIESPTVAAPAKPAEDSETGRGATTTMWNRIAADKARSLEEYGGLRVVIAGIGHADFSDGIFMSPLRRFTRIGDIPAKRVARILNAYIVAFFQQTLLDIPSPLLLAESQPFAEATLQVWLARETA